MTALNPIIVIPARMQATRLPGKPLADICGEPMIVHVWRRAMQAGIGPVVVACSEPQVFDAVYAHGGNAVMTDPDHPSGSDRVWEAVEKLDPDRAYDAVVNVQGDLPTLEPSVIRAVFAPLETPGVDIATLVTEITIDEERTNPNVVKAVVSLAPGQRVGRALYFSRATVPANAGPHYHHIGLYAYRRESLRRFVDLPQGVLETREKLEQLRALENGMRIDCALVDTVPLGVDTPADLERARVLLAGYQAKR
ncbi:3-deoxy-manno-octulosonate cytidylyltransferase [Paramagnetospirillum marisnigri]|uniref:3-deoxy-manno-octulosonate cytidylyltransferase n=1 Tax=Paramagnetospirillum marisnigri TaxID=1285242 RepID=A0A178MKD9_9PROT|nr:3-deoxy-manno-octulosonate cytidylyltransferase [Paramagnetospirillum marisnigri]OAN49150.1 3-deoxy-manno-octulosonate cytidylyltransferase [Paramagnetospirillum marisnigri]